VEVRLWHEFARYVSLIAAKTMVAIKEVALFAFNLNSNPFCRMRMMRWLLDRAISEHKKLATDERFIRSIPFKALISGLRVS
jgi:hypothetical protein